MISESLEGKRPVQVRDIAQHGIEVSSSVPQRTSNCKEIRRENKGQTHTRTKIGKRVASTIERMGIVAKRIAQREKKGDG